MRILESTLASKTELKINPPEPPETARKTFQITFDWGEGSTQGMLEALWDKGFHTKSGDRYPRTTIICRIPASVKDQAVLDLVAGKLLDNGSATVVRVGGSRIHIWPDKPWNDEKKKRWGGWNA